MKARRTAASARKHASSILQGKSWQHINKVLNSFTVEQLTTMPYKQLDAAIYAASRRIAAADNDTTEGNDVIFVSL